MCLDVQYTYVSCLLALTAMHVKHKLDAMRQGRLNIELQADYYNRSLSGWEPLLESWRAAVTWTLNDITDANKSAFNITSKFGCIVLESSRFC